MLVEDNPTDVFVIKEVLDGIGRNLRLQVAANGQEALFYLRSSATACPALILLDLNLPKVAGIDVLKELRTSSRCKHTPVIVLTSSTAESDRAATRSLGAEAYFQKPGDLAAYGQLAQLIKQILHFTDLKGAGS